MADEDSGDVSYYNLEGGQRLLVVKDGSVKAVAPGLRLVEPTDEERKRAEKKAPPQKSQEYGLPV